MNEIELSYLAAIIDGEGSIGIELLSKRKNRPKEYYACRLTVINTYLPLMHRLVAAFGGSFGARKAIAGRKTCYAWRNFGKKLDQTLLSVLPYLDEKKKLAELVLKFRSTVGDGQWNVTDEVMEIRRSLWQECKKINNP